METVKVALQGNETVVPIPKSFRVQPGTEFRITKGNDGTLTLIPAKQPPATIGKLFKDWHGKYQMPDDLKEWENL